MEIKNLKDLSKIATLCRKKGIETLKLSSNSVEFTLSQEETVKRTRKTKAQVGTPTSDYIPVESPFNENDALFWSAQGIPDPVKG